MLKHSNFILFFSTLQNLFLSKQGLSQECKDGLVSEYCPYRFKKKNHHHHFSWCRKNSQQNSMSIHIFRKGVLMLNRAMREGFLTKVKG